MQPGGARWSLAEEYGQGSGCWRRPVTVWVQRALRSPQQWAEQPDQPREAPGSPASAWRPPTPCLIEPPAMAIDLNQVRAKARHIDACGAAGDNRWRRERRRPGRAASQTESRELSVARPRAIGANARAVAVLSRPTVTACRATQTTATTMSSGGHGQRGENPPDMRQRSAEV